MLPRFHSDFGVLAIAVAPAPLLPPSDGIMDSIEVLAKYDAQRKPSTSMPTTMNLPLRWERPRRFERAGILRTWMPELLLRRLVRPTRIEFMAGLAERLVYEEE